MIKSLAIPSLCLLSMNPASFISSDAAQPYLNFAIQVSNDQEENQLIEEAVHHFSSQWKVGSQPFTQPVALILNGHPGSGKTSLICQLEATLNLVPISPDAIRYFLQQKNLSSASSLESILQKVHEKLLCKASSLGYSLALDLSSEGLSEQDIGHFFKHQAPDYQLIRIYLKASLDILIKRMKFRERFKNQYRRPEEQLYWSLQNKQFQEDQYDLIFDTDRLSLEQEVDQINYSLYAYQESPPFPFASFRQFLTYTKMKTGYQFVEDCLLSENFTYLSQTGCFPCRITLYHPYQEKMTHYLYQALKEDIHFYAQAFRRLKSFLKQPDAEQLLLLYAEEAALDFLHNWKIYPLDSEALDSLLLKQEPPSLEQQTADYFEMYRATTPTEEKIQLLCRQAFQHSEKNHNCWYPFDENRVLLPHSNYVSACYVHSGHFNYMACQAPIASTIDAFWEMVISHRSQLILTLANPSEFPNYWPQVGETIRNGEDEIIGLNIEALSRFEDKDVIVKRVFKVKHQGEEWIVNQLHFMNWPDRGIIQLDYLQRFIELADSLDEAYPSHFTVIHCLGGIGRTGVIMAAREIYRAFKIHAQDNDPKDFTYPIKELVYRLRRQRLAMVHTLKQYLLLHQHLDSLRYSLINK